MPRLQRQPMRGLANLAAALVLFVATLVLTGCPGPNYAPYDNMTNSPGVG